MTALSPSNIETNIELGMRLAVWFEAQGAREGSLMVKDLQAMHGVSRATAYRWLHAYRHTQEDLDL